MTLFTQLIRAGGDLFRQLCVVINHCRHRCRTTGPLLLLLSTGPLAAETLIIDGSTGVKPLVQALTAGFVQLPNAVDIQIGSGLKPKARISALLKKDIDIAMASHGIDIEQITQQGLQVHRFAKMAVVMAVNQDVAVTDISHQQLCDVYAGKLTNWQSFDVPDLVLNAFIRPLTEVDAEVFRNQVACFSVLEVSKEIKVINKSGAMARLIATTPGAIGMSTMVRVAQSNGKMKAIAINGVAPDTQNMLSGAYPHTRDSFLITHEKPSETVKQFLAFIKSEQGADIIIANNAVPVL